MEPLVTSKWGQGAPYNNLLPTTVKNGQTVRCVTGCEATALAQILYYHGKPASGQGSHTIYFPWGETTGQAFTADFSAAHYDFAAMRDTYNGNGDGDGALAVARLMLDCGILANMVYDPTASAAFNFEVAHGLKKYLGLPQTMRIVYRDYFGEADWMDLIYNDINKRLPVLYTGVDAYAGGHAFVLDGYDAGGLVHVNWGWDGQADGYYDVALLNPTSPSRRFEYDQNMITGLDPANQEPLRRVEVSVATAGTLEQQLAGQDALTISQLKVSGPLNGKDLAYLRYLAGNDGSSKMTRGVLSHLDLSDARIVKGGGAFLTISGFNYEADEDDKLPVMTFYDCEQLWQLKLPNSLKRMGEGALAQCVGLEELTLPQTGQEEFAVRDGLVYDADGGKVLQCLPNTELAVEVDKGVEEIADYAFLGNSRLYKVTLPAGLKRVGDLSFYNSTNIRELHFRSAVPPTCGYFPFSGLERDCKVFVPKGAKAAYAANSGFSLFNSYGNIVEEEVEEEPAFVPHHRVLLEEYTGTWCGWCPRGFVGLERVNELMADDVICVSYHNEDPMEFLAQADMPWNEPLLGHFTGFPSASLDRTVKTDAYCGDLYDGEFGIDQACSRQAQVEAPADIEVEARWSDDTQTAVEVTTTVTFANNQNSQPWELSYILVANGLTGAGGSWAQSNYFHGESLTWPNDDMKPFTQGGSKVTGLTFNFVAAGWSGPYTLTGSLPANVSAGVDYSHTYTFDLNKADASKAVRPASIIQDKSQLYVVALLVNKKTGAVANANKATVGGQLTNSITAPPAEEPAPKTGTQQHPQYNLAGQRVADGYKGLVISRGKKTVTVRK